MNPSSQDRVETRMVVETPSGEKTAGKEDQEEKFEATLQRLEEIENRYDNFLKEREEEKKTLEKLQGGM